MSEVVRYGVFKLGQVWCVADDADDRIAFPERDDAIAAARAMAAVHRACGTPCEVVAQDFDGFLEVIERVVSEGDKRQFL